MPEQGMAQARQIRLNDAERSIKQALIIGASGAFGGVLAALADLTQKEQASAVLKINEMLQTTLQIPTRPIIVVGLLVAFGIALSFVFGADSSKKAFYTGASILSIMMALVPYKIPPSLSTSPNQPPSGSVTETGWLDQYVMPGVVLAQVRQAAAVQSVHVHLAPSGGMSVASAIYSLVEPRSRRVIARSKIQGSDFSFFVASNDYILRVEVPGYSIVERSLNGGGQDLTIPLSETKLPLFIQRAISKP